MTPPALPVAQKKSGCLRLAILIGALAMGCFMVLAIIGFFLRPSHQKVSAADSIPAAEPPKEKAPEAKKTTDLGASQKLAVVPAEQSRPVATPPPSPDPTPQKTVPQQVEELVRKQFPKGYRRSEAFEDPSGHGWILHIEVFDDLGSAAGLQRGIVDLAAVCHPEGMKVADFHVTIVSSFTDGLGNSSEGVLVKTRVNQEIADRINWRDPLLIEFHKAFETEFVHRSFKQKWGDSSLF